MLKVKFLQDYAMDGHVQKKWSIVSVDEDRALFLQTHQIAELVKASIGKHFGTGLATGLVVKSPEESQTGKPEKVPDELKFVEPVIESAAPALPISADTDLVQLTGDEKPVIEAVIDTPKES